MKKIFYCLLGLYMINFHVQSQDLEKQAPQGFNVKRTGISHGSIDTISYESKTVGVWRKALVYTPPGY